MSSTTTQRSSDRAFAAWEAAQDEPEFQVQFTSDDGLQRAPTSRFRWTGWGRLRIGPHGVVVTARRHRWLWFHREERTFIPSAEIRNVYRDAGVIRVELRDSAARQAFFQFRAGDLRSAATIVALLPTASTVELDEPRTSLPRFDEPAAREHFPVRRLIITGTACVAILAAALAARYEIRAPEVHAPANTPQVTPRVNTAPGNTTQVYTTPDSVAVRGTSQTRTTSRPPKSAETADSATAAEILAARVEFARFEPRIEGLVAEFTTAFNALQSGSLSPEDFCSGLEKWLIPQWQALQNELAALSPARDSLRYGVHKSLSASAALWQTTLATYASGLRAQDSETVRAAFTQMRQAEDFEQQARHWVTSARADPPE